MALGAIGAAVCLAGQEYDESLFGLDPAALAAPTTGRTPANTIVIASQVGTVAAADGPVGWLGELQVSGWKKMGEIESFDAADLYVKINGRAEQYLAYDVVGLDCASFTNTDGDFIDVFLYEMGTPSRAFGIYAVELDREAPSVDRGRGGYRSGASLFFWQGGFYVQILASTLQAPLPMRRTRSLTPFRHESLIAARRWAVWSAMRFRNSPEHSDSSSVETKAPVAVRTGGFFSRSNDAVYRGCTTIALG